MSDSENPNLAGRFGRATGIGMKITYHCPMYGGEDSRLKKFTQETACYGSQRQGKMGKIIAFTGAHGTGKTTAVYELAAKMKKEAVREMGLILETARRCPFPVFGREAMPGPEAQMWIFVEQIRCEIEACRSHELTVADRTVADVIAYSRLCGFADLAEAQLHLTRHHTGIYEAVYFRPVADNPYLVDDGFRSTDRAFQIELERQLLEVYERLGIQLVTPNP